MRPLLAVVVAVVGLACQKKPAVETPAIPPAEDPLSFRRGLPPCGHGVAVISELIKVDSTAYLRSMPRDGELFDEPIEDVDRVVSTAPVKFTLVRPFDRPINGSVSAPVTLRRTIDAIRASVRAMYEGATIKTIPNSTLKDVNGPYGRALFGIDDLFIARIERCDGDVFDVTIDF
jgi:hypothetical protein